MFNSVSEANKFQDEVDRLSEILKEEFPQLKSDNCAACNLSDEEKSSKVDDFVNSTLLRSSGSSSYDKYGLDSTQCSNYTYCILGKS